MSVCLIAFCLSAILSVTFSQKVDAQGTPATISDASAPLPVPPKNEPKPPRGPGTPAAAKPIETKCMPGYSHAYGRGEENVCEVLIDRQKPVAPLPLKVTKGTTIQIRVTHRSNLETIQFVPTNTTLPPVDLGASLFSNFSGIMTGFVAVRPRPSSGGTQAYDESLQRPYDVSLLVKAQDHVKNRIETEVATLNELTDQVKSLEEISDEGFNKGVDKFLRVMGDLPLSEASDPSQICVTDPRLPECGSIGLQLKSIDIQIAADVAECASFSLLTDCKSKLIQLQQRQAVLNSALAKVQAKEQTLKTASEAIAGLPSAGDYIYQVHLDRNVSSSIKISAKDVLSGTSTDLTTVVISWQTTSFSVSAGLMVSTMPGRAFTNGPEIVNGAPNGKISVTETDTKPSWVTPLALFNWEAKASHNADWGLLFSAGAGSNLTTKTADFAIGPSVRFRDLIITPALHYGKETILTKGVFVGDTNLGSGVTAPTGTEYRPHFGVAFTYRIKLP